MMTAATAVAVAIESTVTIPNLSLVFVIPVVVAAVTFGLGSSLFSAILGALAYNFFLTEPRYTLMVDDPANIWAIALLFAVGCIASAVASTARRKADDVALLKRQASALQIYSRDTLAADNTRAIIVNTASALEALFQVPVVVMIMSEAAVDLIEKRGKFELLDVELQAGRSSLATGKLVPARVYPFDTSRSISGLWRPPRDSRLSSDWNLIPKSHRLRPVSWLKPSPAFLPWLSTGSISRPDLTCTQ